MSHPLFPSSYHYALDVELNIRTNGIRITSEDLPSLHGWCIKTGRPLSTFQLRNEYGQKATSYIRSTEKPIMISFKLLFATALVATTTSAQNVSLRYMPLGDSITEATCWRAKLWHKFQGTEWSTVNFVGSSHGDNNCRDNQYDKDSEGHSGFLAINIANAKQTDGWLKNNPADVVTIHLGTNDLAYNHAVKDIISAFTSILTSIRTANPRMKIIVSTLTCPKYHCRPKGKPCLVVLTCVQVAQIIPMMRDHAHQDATAVALNQQLIPWAQGLNKTESPIWIVDQHTGMTDSDMRDGLHPNDAGDTKMANVFYPALLAAFSAAKANKAAL